MIPSKHSRSLYFTPRTPWGRYPQNRPGQNYLRASQDKPADRQGAPQSLSGQITPERAAEMNDQTPKFPPFRLRPSQSSQQPQPAGMALSHTSQAPLQNNATRSFSSAVSPAPQSKPGWGLVWGGEGNKPTPGKLDGSVWFGAASNPAVFKNQKEWEEEHPSHASTGSTTIDR
jgi:hypothetical protein